MDRSETSASAKRRQQTIDSLTRGVLDILIVGGGIVGAGIARDAAMRGLQVGLVEQHDFAFGTSSRSSRLLHGGLRYLAQGRVGLVHEASVEKKVIHKIAPHLAEPLPFIFPTYRSNKDWVLWQLKIGVKIYDVLCNGRNLGRSTWLDKDEVLTTVPALAEAGLEGAVRYYDGFTNDARLTIDTLRSAAKNGAHVLNYCRLLDAIPGDNWTCTVEDQLGQKESKVRARIVINATGPWAQTLRHSSVKLRLAKGIHIVVDRSKVPVPDTVVMTEGKRILFAIPWGERTILGTTDTDYKGSLDNVMAGEEDISYVLDITNQFFPRARLDVEDVISTWAGVRPLIADPNGSPSDISRSHEIRNPHSGWWDVAGGKLTTYRLIAEQTIDRILGSLPKSQRHQLNVTPCRTAEEPLLPPSETEDISSIVPPAFHRQVVEHYCTNEWSVHLADVMLRRTSWHYYFRDAGEKAEQVTDWMGEALGWSDTVRAEELEAYRIAAASPSPAARLQAPLVEAPLM